MRVNCGGGGNQRLPGPLSKDTGDDSGQHVTHPGRRHPGITTIDEERSLTRGTDQGAMTFENCDPPVLRIQSSYGTQSIPLYVRSRSS